MHDATARVPAWQQLHQAARCQVVTHGHPWQVRNADTRHYEMAQGEQVVCDHARHVRYDDALVVVTVSGQLPVILPLGTAPMQAGQRAQ